MHARFAQISFCVPKEPSTRWERLRKKEMKECKRGWRGDQAALEPAGGGEQKNEVVVGGENGVTER
eukprot:2702885-Pleurochrysis_carterae.AAC.1